ncbi:hypothetical protein LMG24238_00094 [Paraburkholderia sediminicola]|uniref:DUF2199 domain-containing protein n=1 Tax=Paraburkholderia sediminicola TaxID=458836 RepID=A0A6J4ZRK0_9BURK|nr:DUF2199 domain-containing protein [Paraburkholderia sediminicola]CAB3638865.1 hypothetical protein LMG24238_00094 [Paraburkholderia sediminicola]
MADHNLENARDRMGLLRFKCSQCSEWHEGEPSIGFKVPGYLLDIPEADRAARAWWNEDLCVIDSRYFFARACLEIPIIRAAEPFLWGIWVSLSEHSFKDYESRLVSGKPGGPYFSWLANQLPGYPSVEGLKARTFPQAGTDRPLIELAQTNHPLSIDFHSGITEARAQELFALVLHPRSILH